MITAHNLSIHERSSAFIELGGLSLSQLLELDGHRSTFMEDCARLQDWNLAFTGFYTGERCVIIMSYTSCLKPL